jgi:hypothetical protein
MHTNQIDNKKIKNPQLVVVLHEQRRPAVVLALQLLVAATHSGVPSWWAATLARLVAARPRWRRTASL